VTGTAHRSDAVQTLRCECGRLLARVLESAIELKCARCKRVVILVGGRRYEKANTRACDCLESLDRAKSNSQPRNNGPYRSQ
jgi:phage FluMu protein Com